MFFIWSIIQLVVVGYLVAGIIITGYLAREFKHPTRTEIICLIFLIFLWAPVWLREMKKEKQRQRQQML